MTLSPLLEVNGLGVSFRGRTVLRDISFTIGRGQTVALVGPNGSGKSVLFRALLGLIPYSGTVRWMPGVRIAYVPQHLPVDAELPLTVGEFFGLKGVSRRDAVEQLSRVGMGADHSDPSHALRHISEHILPQLLGTLSGGQLQRVMIAWSLADNPDVLLFDEPTSGIDVSGQESVYTLLEKLRNEKGLTLLLISHDLDMVHAYADHVLCISGRLVCHGPPKQALDEHTLRKLYGHDFAFTAHTHTHEH